MALISISEVRKPGGTRLAKKVYRVVEKKFGGARNECDHHGGARHRQVVLRGLGRMAPRLLDPRSYRINVQSTCIRNRSGLGMRILRAKSAHN